MTDLEEGRELEPTLRVPLDGSVLSREGSVADDRVALDSCLPEYREPEPDASRQGGHQGSDRPTPFIADAESAWQTAVPDRIIDGIVVAEVEPGIRYERQRQRESPRRPFTGHHRHPFELRAVAAEIRRRSGPGRNEHADLGAEGRDVTSPDHEAQVESGVAQSRAGRRERGRGGIAAEDADRVVGLVARFNPSGRKCGADRHPIEELEPRRQIGRQLGRDDVGCRRVLGGFVLGDVARAKGIQRKTERQLGVERRTLFRDRAEDHDAVVGGSWNFKPIEVKRLLLRASRKSHGGEREECPADAMAVRRPGGRWRGRRQFRWHLRNSRTIAPQSNRARAERGRRNAARPVAPSGADLPAGAR